LALYTSAIPPRPSKSNNWYLPNIIAETFSLESKPRFVS
jgi:hypothetical protein